MYGLVALLATVAITIAGLAWYALNVYQTKVDRIEQASLNATIGERVNGMVLATVMESRGLYIAATPDEVEKFAKPLLADLKALDGLLDEWERVTPGSERTRFDAVKAGAKEFIAFRTKLVELARTKGAPAGREFGDNDANRTNRQALNKAIESLAQWNQQRIDAVVRDLDAFQEQMRWAFSVLAGSGVLAVVVLAWIIVRRTITGPLAAITGAIQRLADGGRGVEIPCLTMRDEIGALAHAAEIFKRNGEEMLRLQEQAAATQARSEEQRRIAMHRLADQFETAMAGVVQSVADSAETLRTSARSLTRVTEDTQRRASDAATAASQTSGNVQAVAVAAEEMAASVNEIAQQMLQSSQIADAAARQAARTDATVGSLSEAANRIGEIVGLIHDIASQTNLLALNATIEAARAGEAGKGFAVVASEVKSLANQTAKATDDISTQIVAIQTATAEAVTAIQAIGATIGRVNEIGTTISAAVEEQGAVTNGIARSATEAATGTRRVSDEVTGVTGAVESTEREASGLLTAADTLALQAESLKQEMTRFLQQVRAA